MMTICLINQKGGCGKSSTCFHLAGAMALQGRRVLVVDVDPQGSLSQGFLGPSRVENLDARATVAVAFADEDLGGGAARLLQPTGFDGITLLPANHHVSPLNVPQPERLGIQQFALRTLITDLCESRLFDIALIDCPPNLYLCSWTALIASDYVVIPVPPEDFGTQGLRAVHQAIEHARLLNPSLDLLGHLVTRSDRRLLIHRSYERKLREIYTDSVLDTVVPEASAFKVALACRQPVGYFDARSLASEVTSRLAHEIFHRIRTETRTVATV